jgi:hypothetical protein
MGTSVWNRDRLTTFLEREESDTVEFKSSRPLAASDTQREFIANLCKHVGAFLNGEGGIVLIGLEEGDRKARPDIATRLSPGIPRKLLKASDLENMICDRIHPSVAGFVKVFAVVVDESDGLPGCAFVVEIRSGITAYQSPDKMYYIRRGHSSEAMEDKDIRLRMLTHHVAKVNMAIQLRRGYLANSVGTGAIRGSIPIDVAIHNAGLKTIRQCDLLVSLQPIGDYLSNRLNASDEAQRITKQLRLHWPSSSETLVALHPDQRVILEVGTLEILREWDVTELQLGALVICYLEDAPSVTCEIDISEQLQMAWRDLDALSKAQTMEDISAIRLAASRAGLL